jgi:DNA polymerase-1
VRSLLIDGDIVAYQIATKYERGPDWDGDGNRSTRPDHEHLRETVAAWIRNLERDLNARGSIVAMSDPTRRYFRHDLWPTYKAGRQQGTPPSSLGLTKEILRHESKMWSSVTMAQLEADDVLGILAGEKSSVEKVVVTEDKDLAQIPGLHFWLHRRAEGIENISVEQGDYFHLWQTLVGDPIDGYPGLKRVGPVRAAAILNVEPEQRWEAIVAAYEVRGFDESYALTQARVARILRVEDFDKRTKEPILWQPS